MTTKLGVVMDPIGRIKPQKDTTLAMLLAVQRRGWELHYMELGDIGLRDDGVIKPYDATETLLNEVLSFSMRDGAKPSEGGAGGPGGQVQVKAYVQHRGGKPVQVAGHVRSASGEGVGNGSDGSNSTDPLPPMSSPVANPRIRGKDGYSSGQYGASRDGGTRSHDGVAVVTEPGETVVSPVTGTYQAPFDPYNK